MARRKGSSRLDQALDLWARWCVSLGAGSGAGTLLARWMDNRGHMTFGGSSGASGAHNVLEADIEACVMRMAVTSPAQAKVVRLEYGAFWQCNAARLGFKGYDPLNATQLDRALCLGISHRTYERHLAAARKTIQEMLECK